LQTAQGPMSSGEAGRIFTGKLSTGGNLSGGGNPIMGHRLKIISKTSVRCERQ